MKRRRYRRSPKTLSVDSKQPDAVLRAAVLWGLLGLSGVAAAADAAAPDIEFLEYLGSWEDSDEDWVLFVAEAAEQVAVEKKRTDPASKDEESVETDDES